MDPDALAAAKMSPGPGIIDFGHYFTQHLKADAGLMWTSERYFYNSTYTYPQNIPFHGPPAGPLSPRPSPPAFTYQF
jgi:hypothetical protein